MAETEFILADAGAAEPITQLLLECGLPYKDISNHLHNFILANRSGRTIGVVGLELYGRIALLRSLAVAVPDRGQGLARALFTRAAAHALLQGVNALYLLTTTAAGFFAKLGFSQVERNNAPEAIRHTREFQSICPATAVCMVKDLENQAQYFPREGVDPPSRCAGSKDVGHRPGKDHVHLF